MGDPAGVGPEVLLKSYKKARETQDLIAISDFYKRFFSSILGEITVLSKLKIKKPTQRSVCSSLTLCKKF